MKCENCKKKLEFEIYAINVTIGGLSVMEHKIHPRYVILCEECRFDYEGELKEESCWGDLDLMDNSPDMCIRFRDVEELGKWLKGFEEEEK